MTAIPAVRPRNVLMGAYIPELEHVRGMAYESGKVRENYASKDERILITTDRISAFDVVMRQGIQFKGKALNGISRYWFKKTQDIVPNHIRDVLDPNVWVAEQCMPYMVEVIVRGYLAGSSAADYAAGSRVKSGVPLPDGLKRNQKFEQPILTPTTKAERGKHDEDISAQQVVEKGLVPADVWKQTEEAALKLFDRGTQLAAQRGLILVDTKYEFGRGPDGGLRLIDEIHTPDSSRYWIATDYDAAMAEGRDPKQLSKEFLREELKKVGFTGQTQNPPDLSQKMVEEVSSRYVDLFQKVTSEEFTYSQLPIQQRVLGALRDAGYIKGSFVPVIAGSKSDEPHYSKITKRLEEKGRAHNVFHYSADKQAEELLRLTRKLETSLEPVVFIAVAGRSNALGGFLAGNMRNKRPVISCPPFADMATYQVDIHSSLRKPSEVPTATIIDPANAADFADLILAESERLLA